MGLKAKLGAGLFGLALGAAWYAPAVGLGVPLIIPETGRSMPAGFYRYAHSVPAKVGDIVVEREPADYKAAPWLIKRVVGTAGSVYCWDEELGTHRLDGEVMPPPDPKLYRLGLRPWTGCGLVDEGELVVYGQSADSYDSRVRGIRREDQMWGVYAPLWLITK